MDRKQKQYLRAKVCQLMDDGKADEAKKWMDLLLVDEQRRGRKPNSQFTQVRVTRPDGEEQATLQAELDRKMAEFLQEGEES